MTLLWTPSPVSAIPTATVTPTPTLAPNVRQLQVPEQAHSAWPRISEDGGVVFYGDEPNVFLATTDGLHGRAVTDVQNNAQPKGCFDPHPSADGNLVAMACTADVTDQNPDRNSEIVLRDLIRDRYLPITTSHDPFDNGVSDLSADGSSILFRSNANWAGKNLEGIYELFLFHGGQYSQVTKGGDNEDVLLPFLSSAISRDGNLVGYSKEIVRSGDSAFLLYDARTGQTTEPVACHPMLPVLFTRDGRSLVYIAGATCDGTPTLPYQMYIETFGQGRRTLLQLNGFQLYEVVSNTDGSRIVVVTNDAVPHATLLTPSNSQLLSGLPAEAGQLSFDGAGRKLAFVSQCLTSCVYGGRGQLFVADLALDSDTPTPTRTMSRTPTIRSTPTPTPPSTPFPTIVPCLGDCDGGDDVTVNELITMVNIALGTANVSNCPVGDADASGDITIDEIIAAVNNALTSCPAS
ncbi:MAG: hypothetical protein HY270_06055 [Deltaproteobacteria bacterium]|nr:hypothetical protein [Deltaproteobacteria bacterium]